MKQFVCLSMLIMMLVPASTPDIRADSKSNNDEAYAECDAKCSPLSGADRYKCIQKCVSAKRKTDPGSRDAVKKRMEECENACSDNEGVDRIKCIRACLDGSKQVKVKPKEKIDEEEDPCKSRCAVLTGSLKDKCLMKCMRDKKFNRDDSSGSRKK